MHKKKEINPNPTNCGCNWNYSSDSGLNYFLEEAIWIAEDENMMNRDRAFISVTMSIKKINVNIHTYIRALLYVYIVHLSSSYYILKTKRRNSEWRM